MSDKPNNDKPVNLYRWGLLPDAVLHNLRDKAVAVKCVDGKLYKGVLVGLSQYQLVIVQAGGLELIINKGNVIYAHGAEVET